MARIARLVIPGIPHHVTQRSNRGEEILATNSDRSRYLRLLAEYSQNHGLRVHAYCLMSNHVHLVVVPETTESLAATLKPVHLRFAQEFNRRYGIRGVLWQGRFYSCPLDERHFWMAVRYVEQNPVRAGVLKRAEDYAWSSAQGHCGVRPDPLLSGGLDQAGVVEDWRAWLAEGMDEKTIEFLRARTRSGRPGGDDVFVAELEKLMKRSHLTRPVGRPKRNQVITL